MKRSQKFDRVLYCLVGKGRVTKGPNIVIYSTGLVIIVIVVKALCVKVEDVIPRSLVCH